VTKLQVPPSQQRIPVAGGYRPVAGRIETSTFVSPLEAWTVMQTAIEGAREHTEETQALRPILPEDAERIMLWAAADSLDWDRLTGSIEGWGTPEP
jgi:hypothetical protein